MALMAIFSCASMGGNETGTVSLDEAIQASAERLGSDLTGRKVAVVAFASPSEALSEYIIEELSMALANSKAVTAVDRRELDLVREELALNLSGEVSDESAQSIGKMLGAEAVITGSIADVGGVYRFRVKALHTESAVIESAPGFDLNKRDGRIAYLLEGRRVAASAVEQPPAARNSQPVQPTALPPERPVSEGFVHIQGGTFMMGSPMNEPDRNRDETQHRVTLSSFYMGKYEVTQKEWRDVMGTNPSEFKGDDLPVECVNWYDAVEYCNTRSRKEGLSPAYTIDKGRSDPNNSNYFDDMRWLVTWNRNANGYRLPTEAEWEYACRAETTTPFNTGNNITTLLANYNGKYPYNNMWQGGTYLERTTTVGSFAPNPWGLYDMHGNVTEWCWDWGGDYSSGAQTDPSGPVSGSTRVTRGGSYMSSREKLRSAWRMLDYPWEGHAIRSSPFGFRLARNGE